MSQFVVSSGWNRVFVRTLKAFWGMLSFGLFGTYRMAWPLAF